MENYVLKFEENSMIELSQVSKDKTVLIKQINAQPSLKKRLFSLGLSVGKEITVSETSLQKNTIKIALGFSSVALRLDEAKAIVVEMAS